RVVARPREAPVAGLGVDLLQVARGRARRLLRIAPLVDPEVLAQAHAPAGRRDELPRSHGTGAAPGQVREAALDHRDEDRVLWQTLLAHDAAEDGHVLLR